MHCNIIEDLLPLYTEGLCSAESRAAVETHVSGCEACREKLARLQAGLPDTAPVDDTGAGALKKVKRGILASSLLAAGCLLLVIGLGLIIAASLLYQNEVENLYLTVFLFLIPFVLFCVSTLAGLSGQKKRIALSALLIVPLVFFGHWWQFSVPLGIVMLAAGWFWGGSILKSLRRSSFARFRKRLWIALGALGAFGAALFILYCMDILDTVCLLLLLTVCFPMLFYGAAFQICYAARGLLRTGLVFLNMAVSSGVLIAVCYLSVRYFEPFELVYALLPAFAGGLTGILTAQREEEGRNAAL